MQGLFELLERAAMSETTVLLEGETGTGKEASSEAIHSESRRRDGPLVVVDCGSIPHHLLESELFGHERGAFTGAVMAKKGAFEAANGGTILLDEIGELPLELQPKILRAIETRRVKRIGSPTYHPVDVRVIAATNRDLRQEVEEKRFRSDLYYRLAVLKIRLPPLRERMEDFQALIEDALEWIGARDTPVGERLIDPAFIDQLAGFRWSGNVRQLRNYIERCVTLGEAQLPFDASLMPIPVAYLPPPLPEEDEPPMLESIPVEFDDTSVPFKEARDSLLAAFERRYLSAQLARHGDRVSAAARASGMDRVQFYRLLWKHKLRERDEE
jgi:DNA-binding NtrC family response regulator